jgi:pyruvate,water dikinase
MNPAPLTLDDARSLDASLVGAKVAGLARLRAAGFDVPDGVVLPVGLRDAWPDGPAPDWLRATVADACHALGDRLAVRSSATWEDSSTHAHAGATATVLDVSGTDDVLKAARHCLDESAAAQRERGADGEVAILLQTLVPADHAGVAFTADPITGDRDLVRIAATEGLGEALVQGDVVGCDITVRQDEIEGDLAGLPAEAARKVATAAREIEALHGRPQDIEWAVSDGRLSLLQARPITALPVEPTRPSGNNWQKDTAHYPEPLTPFGWSVMDACGDVTHGVFDEVGTIIRGLEEVSVGGEIYSRVLPAFGSADSTGKPPPALVLGVAARLVPELRRRNATARRVMESGQVQQWVDDWYGNDRDDMTERAAELGRVDLADLDDRALHDHFDRFLSLAKRGFEIHFRLVMPYAQALYRLHRLVGDELGWDDTAISAMLAGHSPASRSSEEAMTRLRQRVRDTPGAVDALETDPHHPVEALGALDAELAEALTGWIREHAWAVVNFDPGIAALAERPTIITRLLLADPEPQQFDDAEATAARARDELPGDRRADFDDALERARAVYPLRDENTIVVGDRPLALLRVWMLEVADRLVARGDLPSTADAPYLDIDDLRQALLGHDIDDLAERIERRRGEEAWARAHPGPAYIGEQGAPPDISRLPAPLRAVNEPILWLVSHEYPAPVESPDDASVLLAGVAASAGTAEGPARVIRSQQDMDRLRDGDVLVCQVTSPSWAPIFPLIAAVVADGGGALSHAAIAAREHGIPAVLGTGDATTTLQDGQRIRVDGTNGHVLVV